MQSPRSHSKKGRSVPVLNKEVRIIERSETRQWNGFTITLDEGFAKVVESLLAVMDRVEDQPGVIVIKKNMVRTVYRLEVEGTDLFLKKYHSRGALEVVKSLVRPSRAAAEWNAMNRLIEAGIPTASPILFGDKRRGGILQSAFFAATAVPKACHFGDFVKEARSRGEWKEPLKDKLYGELARLTANLHARGIKHGDYHLGNILVSRGEEGFPRVHIIDLHTVSFPDHLSRPAMLLNLARIAEVLHQLEDGKDLIFFLGKYLQIMPHIAPSLRDLMEEVMVIEGKLSLRRLKSRAKRCLRRSSEFAPTRVNGYKANHRRSYSEKIIAEAIQVHDTVQQEGDPRLLHPAIKNKVTAVEVQGPMGVLKLCVKEYRPRSRMARIARIFSEARTSWIAGRGLEVRGILTPETVAWVRGKGREFLITLFNTGRRLHEYIAASCEGLSPVEAAVHQRVMALELALFVKKIHLAGVRHRDLSEKNIMVEMISGRRHYLLIDCDTVHFRRKISKKDLLRNFVQLSHMPEDVNVLVKARFLEFYLGRKRDPQWRWIMKTVDRRTLERMLRKRESYARYDMPDPHPKPSRLKGQW